MPNSRVGIHKETRVRRGCSRLLVTAAASILCAGATTAVAAPPAAAGTTCSDVRIPVTVPEPAQLAGTLCQPARANSVLQVLIPGGTYSRSYWSQPTRNYTAAANAAGYSTLALDRLATGASTQRNPLTTTVTTNATAVHQAIGRLRDQYHFRHVVLVGHSLGSITAVRENSLYPADASAIVVSGYSRWLTLGVTETLLQPGVTQPAPLAGRPALAGRAAGNLTLSDEARTKALNDLRDFDPAIAAQDNASKDTFTLSEALESFLEVDVPALGAHQVTAPVLVALGSQDFAMSCRFTGFCRDEADLLSTERAEFDRARSVDAYVLPGSGHDMNFANNAPQWFGYAQQWIGTHTHN